MTAAVPAPASAAIFTAAGTGAYFDTEDAPEPTGAQLGDGGPATDAVLQGPSDLAATSDGGFLIVDRDRVRPVSPRGTITTVVGTDFGTLHAVAATADGGFIFTSGAGSVRPFSPSGEISNVAGTGTPGFSGDGGPATAAQLGGSSDVAVTADGGFLIADTFSNHVRRVRPDGTITTVAGTGVEGFSGDGGPATAAQLHRPIGVDPTADGGFLIADSFNHRVRRVAPDGTITTVAGTGVRGFSGDGGPATAAEMGRVWSVAVTAGGAFLVAEPENNRVRRVRPDGTITTVAGTGIGGFSGDGGPATAAQLNGPLGVAPTLDGGFLVADDRNNRVRYVEPPGASRRRLLYAAFLRARLSARLGRRFSLRYVSTAAARVRVCVDRGPCARERIRGGRGAVTLALRRRGRFTVVLTAWGRGGRLVTDRLRLTVR